MKTLYIFCLLLISGLVGKSQVLKSYFYNEKGQLFLDTTLSITKPQFKAWTHAENNLVAGFSNIEFPPYYLENAIKPGHSLIVSFVCDTSDIHDINVLNDTSGFAIAVIKGLQKQGSGIAELLKTGSRATSERNYVGKYYFAIDFVVVDFYEYLKTQRAVPVIRGSTPLVDKGSF
jgi:hypothetical protein